jgi:hypothetical protein
MSFEGIKMGRIPKSIKESNIYNDNCVDNSEGKFAIKGELNEYHNFSNSLMRLGPQIEDKTFMYEILKNVSYEIFKEYIIHTNRHRDYAKTFLIENNYCQSFSDSNGFSNNSSSSSCSCSSSEFDATKVWKLLQPNIIEELLYAINYLKKLPGFNHFCNETVNNLIKENMLLVNIFKNSRLYINDEYYYILKDNFHFNKHWAVEIFGNEIAEALFDCLKKVNYIQITEHELSLIIPFSLSITGLYF